MNNNEIQLRLNEGDSTQQNNLLNILNRSTQAAQVVRSLIYSETPPKVVKVPAKGNSLEWLSFRLWLFTFLWTLSSSSCMLVVSVQLST